MKTQTKMDQTINEICKKLAWMTNRPEIEIEPSQRVVDLLSKEGRRQKWQELRVNGFNLPDLELSLVVFNLIAWFLFAIVLFLAIRLENWLVMVMLVELGFLAYKLTRPWAVHTPIGCETVREMALHLTPFRKRDYEAGLWTTQEIDDKVRWIVAIATRNSFDEVKPESRLLDLTGC